MLARTDIPTVLFSLPIATQPALIEKALKAGKNVISEKPVAPSIEEGEFRPTLLCSSFAHCHCLIAKRLIELYEKEYRPKGQSWIIAEHFPWELSYCKARKWVQEGKLGEIRGFSAEVYIQPSAMARNTGWRQVPDYQGGYAFPLRFSPEVNRTDTSTPVLVDRYILDGGVHFVAGLRHILPYPITSIFATSSQLQKFLPPCDTLTGVLTSTPPTSSSSSSPISGTFTFSFGNESGTARHYTILGSKASLKVDFSGGSKHTLTLSTLTTNPEESEPHNTVIEFGQHGVEEEFDAFGQALLDGSGSESWKEVMRRSGPRATLRDLGVIEGGLKSSKEGKAIDLSELVGGDEWFKIE